MPVDDNDIKLKIDELKVRINATESGLLGLQALYNRFIQIQKDTDDNKKIDAQTGDMITDIRRQEIYDKAVVDFNALSP